MTILRSQLKLRAGDRVIIKRHDRPSLYVMDVVEEAEHHENTYFSGLWLLTPDGRGRVKDEHGNVTSPDDGWTTYVSHVNGDAVVDDIPNPMQDEEMHAVH